MTLTAVNMIWPPEIVFGSYITTAGTLVINAANEKIAFMGPVFHEGNASKSVTKVHFLFSTVSKAGGSGLTVSLQDVDTANGPVMRPDGTPDQTVAIANADANFASSTYYTTAAFSASRSVAKGELLAVVIEFDGTGWLTPDSVSIAINEPNNFGFSFGNSGANLYTGTWGTVPLENGWPNILLEYTDGSFGTLGYGWPNKASATTSSTYASNTTPDEVALKFTIPFKCKCRGASILVLPSSNTADYDVVLYDTDGTTAIGTASVSANVGVGSSVQGRAVPVYWTEVELAAGSTYRLAVKPTTTANVRVSHCELASAAHRSAMRTGTICERSVRTDAGSWTDSTTFALINFSILISEIDDGASAGGGGGLKLAGRGGLAG